MPILTVFPSSSAEDGYTEHDTATAGETIASIVGGAGTDANDSTSPTSAVVIRGGTDTDRYSRLQRNITMFDTSAIGSGSTINSAVISFYISGLANNMSGEASVNSVMVLVSSAPASNTALVSGDFDSLGSTDFGRSDKQDALSTETYEDITLNASGLANISKTGISKFGLKYGWDFDATATGLTWSNTVQGIEVYYNEQGSTKRPRLVINYSTGIEYDLPVTVGVFTLTGIAAILSKGYILVAVVGAFTLTGIAVAFNKVLSMVASVGSFTLTGITAILSRGLNFVVSVGSFILTGISAVFSGTGSWKTTNQAKSTAISPTNQSQNNISPTGQSKSSTVNFKNQEQS